MKKQTPPKKPEPPLKGRKKGDRCVKGLVPPLHPKGEDHKKYRSTW